MKTATWILFLAIIIILSYFLLNQGKPIGTLIDNDEITITYPQDLQNVNGIIKVEGMANEKFKSIEVKINLNEWQRAEGVKNWVYTLDTINLKNGLNIIYARGNDGINYSKIKAVRINIKN
ncbi:MAG: hypothetical protein AABX61_01990 [Nanoarchaeota archaeon]